MENQSYSKLDELRYKINTVKARERKIKYIERHLERLQLPISDKPRTLSMVMLYSAPDSQRIDYVLKENEDINHSIRNMLTLILDELKKEAENDSVKADDIEDLQGILKKAEEIRNKIIQIGTTIETLKYENCSTKKFIDLNISIVNEDESSILCSTYVRDNMPFTKEHILVILNNQEKYYKAQLEGLLNIKVFEEPF